MDPLRPVNVVLGVSGGIAAYKAVEICRRLVDAGAHVVPVLTDDAQRFVGALTFSALASEPARTSLFDGPDPIPHTRLGQAADLVVVAPATAKLLGKYAAGISDDLLTATLLATRAPVLVCPAMHTEMWEHRAVQENLDTLRRRGVHVVEPERGRLAGGDVGAGRLADPERVVAAALALLDTPVGALAGLRVLVTAGGTREPIDAVRFVGNRSSGRMGFALAEEAARRGADVTVVAANVALPRRTGIEYVDVESAADLAEACEARFEQTDLLLMAAAVADYRPEHAHAGKLKKDEAGRELELRLVRTPDVLATLATRRRPGQLLVGFAAEHGDRALEYGREKLARKDLDAVVVNDVGGPGIGFDSPDNEVTVVTEDAEIHVPKAAKAEVATAILDAVLSRRSSSDMKVPR
jgi:phosphopantothenoylcysteine decarboxylase / phosphopantothenate---cysteine ligase